MIVLRLGFRVQGSGSEGSWGAWAHSFGVKAVKASRYRVDCSEV